MSHTSQVINVRPTKVNISVKCQFGHSSMLLIVPDIRQNTSKTGHKKS